MNDNKLIVQPKYSAAKKTTLIVIAALILIVLALIAVVVVASGQNDSPPPNNVSVPANAPDPVKSTSGPNGDTVPSSNGTGPGSNNSLLGR